MAKKVVAKSKLTKNNVADFVSVRKRTETQTLTIKPMSVKLTRPRVSTDAEGKRFKVGSQPYLEFEVWLSERSKSEHVHCALLPTGEDEDKYEDFYNFLQDALDKGEKVIVSHLAGKLYENGTKRAWGKLLPEEELDAKISIKDAMKLVRKSYNDAVEFTASEQRKRETSSEEGFMD